MSTAAGTPDPTPKTQTQTHSKADAPDASGWSASLYNKTASFVYSDKFTAPVLELLNAQPGERIVDFGCGSGEVSLVLQEVVRGGAGGGNGSGAGGVVVGVDASESMVAKAKANGLPHAYVVDIQNPDAFPSGSPDVDQKFDAVFSNATLHWCKRSPRGAIQSAKRVLKEGGRFVGEMGGFMNCVGVRGAMHHVLKSRGYDPIALDPWFFPSAEDYEALLRSESFEPVHVSLTPRITPLSDEDGLAGWLNLFARSSFLKGLSDNEAKEIIDEVVEMCRVDCQDANKKWAMVYIRLRFVAVLKN